MKIWVRFVLAPGAAVLFAGCGGSHGQFTAPAVLPQTSELGPAHDHIAAAAPAYQVLHYFGSGTTAETLKPASSK